KFLASYRFGPAQKNPWSLSSELTPSDAQQGDVEHGTAVVHRKKLFTVPSKQGDQDKQSGLRRTEASRIVLADKVVAAVVSTDVVEIHSQEALPALRRPPIGQPRQALDLHRDA